MTNTNTSTAADIYRHKYNSISDLLDDNDFKLFKYGIVWWLLGCPSYGHELYKVDEYNNKQYMTSEYGYYSELYDYNYSVHYLREHTEEEIKQDLQKKLELYQKNKIQYIKHHGKSYYNETTNIHYIIEHKYVYTYSNHSLLNDNLFVNDIDELSNIYYNMFKNIITPCIKNNKPNSTSQKLVYLAHGINRLIRNFKDCEILYNVSLDNYTDEELNNIHKYAPRFKPSCKSYELVDVYFITKGIKHYRKLHW